MMGAYHSDQDASQTMQVKAAAKEKGKATLGYLAVYRRRNEFTANDLCWATL
jgi:hypothetical protein